MLEKIKAVIFDMDGLMFDTERLFIRVSLDIARVCGYEADEGLLLKTVGMSHSESEKIYADMIGDCYEDYMEKVLAEYDRILAEGRIPLKTGIMELLEYLERKGYRKCVASNTVRGRVCMALKRVGGKERFDQVICGDEVENGKPDPEIYIKACARMNISPDEAVVLEDSVLGLQAANAAGIKCILVPDLIQPTEEQKKLAYMVLPSLVEIIERQIL